MGFDRKKEEQKNLSSAIKTEIENSFSFKSDLFNKAAKVMCKENSVSKPKSKLACLESTLPSRNTQIQKSKLAEKFKNWEGGNHDDFNDIQVNPVEEKVNGNLDENSDNVNEHLEPFADETNIYDHKNEIHETIVEEISSIEEQDIFKETHSPVKPKVKSKFSIRDDNIVKLDIKCAKKSNASSDKIVETPVSTSNEHEGVSFSNKFTNKRKREAHKGSEADRKESKDRDSNEEEEIRVTWAEVGYYV